MQETEKKKRRSRPRLELEGLFGGKQGIELGRVANTPSKMQEGDWMMKAMQALQGNMDDF